MNAYIDVSITQPIGRNINGFGEDFISREVHF